jgi:general secretion pathway protein B
MSYILDALKRADAERERGQVPGLHAQPMTLADGDASAARGQPRWGLIAGAVVVAAIAVAIAWRMGADAHAPMPAPLAAATPEPAAPPPAAPSLAPTAVPVAPAPVVAPAPMPVNAAPGPPPRAVRAPPPAPRASAPSPEAAAAPIVAPILAPIVALAELPADLRRRIPPLVVGGSIYSDDARSRFLILNGDVVHEGGQAAPGLVLERIGPKSAVLRFEDRRFRISY